MALNRLTIAEMVMLIEDWVTPGHPVRVALEQNPSLAALLPSIDAANGLLVNMQPVELANARAQLTRALTDKDARFDHMARAIDGILNAHLSLALADDDQTKVNAIRALIGIILPHGLQVVSMSYREEAGQTALLAQRLTADHEAFMASMSAPGGTLLDLVRAWRHTGAEIGALAHQRADLELPSRRTSQVKARSLWIQTITTVRSVVTLTRIFDPRIEEALGRIAATEAAASRRAHARDGEPVDGEPVDGEPVDGEPAEPVDGEPAEPVDGEPAEPELGEAEQAVGPRAAG